MASEVRRLSRCEEVSRAEKLRVRGGERRFHTGPSTRASRFETRAKRTTTGAQSEGPSDSPLARHGASRAWSSLGTDDANGSAFRGALSLARQSPVGSRANGYRQRRPRRSIIAWHHKQAPTFSRTRAPRVPSGRVSPIPVSSSFGTLSPKFLRRVVPPPSGPTTSSTVSRPARSRRVRAFALSARRSCARIERSGREVSSERRASRGSGRTKERSARGHDGRSRTRLFFLSMHAQMAAHRPSHESSSPYR